MAGHIDVGNVGIYAPAAGGVAIGTRGTWAEAVNSNAVVIGVLITVLSLLIGIGFKWLALKQNERHHREELAAQKEQNAQLAEALRAELRGAKK